MKKTMWLAAAFLAGAAMGAPLAGAEDVTAAGAEAAAAGISNMEETASKLSSSEEAISLLRGGFLPAMDLSGGMSYHPLDLSGVPELSALAGGAAMPVGQLRTEKDGFLQTATVLNMEVRESGDVDALFRGLFEKSLTAEGVLKLAAANQFLSRAGVLANTALLDVVGRIRKETGEPVPYSILYADVRGIEPARLMEETGNRSVYTAGARVLVYADGWVIPLYARAYLWKTDDAYRAVLLWTDDSMKDAAKEAGDRLVRRAAE